MIEYQILRSLVLKALQDNPQSSGGLRKSLTSFISIKDDVQQLAIKHEVFPSEEECKQNGINDYFQYYREKRLKPIDEENINQIIWDLIIDRILTPGSNSSNPDLPNLRLTKFGHAIINQEAPPFYDPQEYASLIKSFTNELDPLIEQYVIEGLNCFGKRLLFAAAVMFGAAAETAILILLDAIGKAEADPKRKEKVEKLLNGQTKLPEIFKAIQDAMLRAKGTMPYSVYQGSEQHLLSFFEMIRVQRNDAVHPAAGKVDKTKVFLTIQTFPTALAVLYQLVGWFSVNKI